MNLVPIDKAIGDEPNMVHGPVSAITKTIKDRGFAVAGDENGKLFVATSPAVWDWLIARHETLKRFESGHLSIEKSAPPSAPPVNVYIDGMQALASGLADIADVIDRPRTKVIERDDNGAPVRVIEE